MPTLDPAPALPGTKQTAVDPANPAANEQLSATEANQLSGVLGATRTALGPVDDGAAETVALSLGKRAVMRVSTADGIFADALDTKIIVVTDSTWALPDVSGEPDGTIVYRAA